jgi:hypothetical protein
MMISSCGSKNESQDNSSANSDTQAQAPATASPTGSNPSQENPVNPANNNVNGTAILSETCKYKSITSSSNTIIEDFNINLYKSDSEIISYQANTKDSSKITVSNTISQKTFTQYNPQNKTTLTITTDLNTTSNTLYDKTDTNLKRWTNCFINTAPKVNGYEYELDCKLIKTSRGIDTTYTVNKFKVSETNDTNIDVYSDLQFLINLSKNKSSNTIYFDINDSIDNISVAFFQTTLDTNNLTLKYARPGIFSKIQFICKINNLSI